MIYLLLLGLLVLAFVALLALVVGGALGALLGGTIGGLRGWWHAPEDGKELGTYRGVTWGSCLGAMFGLVLAFLLLLLAWNSCLS